MTIDLKHFGLIALLVGCSESEMKSGYAMSDEMADDGDYQSEEPNATDSAGSGGEAEEDHDDGFGSEQESDFMSLRPATTNVYVFVANPDRNTVTRIDVETLQVLTADVGSEPIFVETSSDYTRAVTFDKGSNTVSVIDAETMDVLPVDIRANLNQMRMSPDGKWVVCYHDISADNSGTSGGAITYNAISIVDLEAGVSTDAIVGAHPHDVQFTEDGSMAVIISDDYLSAIDLTADSLIPRRIAIADDLVNPPKAEEVLLDPEGRYAIVRQYGVNELVLVDFDENSSAQVTMLDVGSNPTDMDVSPDGTEAIVIARGSKEIWIYDLEDPTLDPVVIPFHQTVPEGEEDLTPSFGSLVLSPDSSHGVLYSTQINDAAVGFWNRDDQEIDIHGVVKPVSNVGLSPTGETAIISHPQGNGDIDSSSPYFNKYALSLVDMNDHFTTAYKLTSKPSAFASTPDGNIGFYIMENSPYLEILDYRTFVPTEIRLPSIPVHLGTLPDTNTAFASQEHNLGRISFFDTDVGSLETITGFELNSAIEHD